MLNVHAVTGGVDGNAKNPHAPKAAVIMANASMDLAYVMPSGQGTTAQRGGAHVIALAKVLALGRLHTSALAKLVTPEMIAVKKSSVSTTALAMENAH